MAFQAIATNKEVPQQVTSEPPDSSHRCALSLQCSHLIRATTGSYEQGPSYGRSPGAHGVARPVVLIGIWVEL